MPVSFGRPLAVLATVATLAAACATSGPRPPSPAVRDTGLGERVARHVLHRLTFGPRPGDIESVRAMGLEAFLERQLHPERLDDGAVEAALADLATLSLPVATLLRDYPRRAPDAGGQPPPAPPARRPQLLLIELQAARMMRATMSERQLQEVMVDFWLNHFNVFAYKGEVQWYLTSYERDAIRPHALGRFRDLLGAVARHPAMLYYLDNWLSRRDATGRPGLNENYGRELLELHTLGVDGGYTQHDVREVARAFTGWTIERPREVGAFVFRPGMHDPGEKIVLGQRIQTRSGIGDGESVLDLVSRHPATARFIASKLARRFVADDPPAALVERAAAAFAHGDGDIAATVRAIVTAPEFLEGAARSKIKKPSEFVVSAVRALGGRIDTRGGLELARAAARMGEPLYQAQAPTGHPDRAEAWVSGTGLLARLNFAQALAHRQVLGVSVDIGAAIGGADRRRPDVILQRLFAMILDDDVGDTTRLVLTARLDDPQITRTTPDDRRDLRWADTDVETLAALVLGSPEFQRR
ncbi:MAG: DUF1800 domain-containing protein [Candidatus Rokubacteria bacterium]|nr:DUF1800 domain-containing protein [Candidatus Rokubacteria bacterium]